MIEPWAMEERRVWRHVNSWGGYRWPLTSREAEPPMTVDETLDELDWLISCGMPVQLALEQLPDRTPGSLRQAATRRGRLILARRIASVTDEGRHYESGSQKRKKSA